MELDRNLAGLRKTIESVGSLRNSLQLAGLIEKVGCQALRINTRNGCKRLERK